MSIRGLFNIGGQKIIREGYRVKGTVFSTKTFCWLKINTTPVRASSMDGAAIPHIISFRYVVDGVDYRGSRYVSWTTRCPVINETINVYYDLSKPSMYAVDIKHNVSSPTSLEFRSLFMINNEYITSRRCRRLWVGGYLNESAGL